MKRLLIVAIVVLLLGACTRATLSSTIETTMSVTPTPITVTPGQSFTINITVSNVTNLNSWQVALKYNATIVNCTAAWIPQKNVFENQSTIPGSPVLNSPTIDGYNFTLVGNLLLTGSVNVTQGILLSLNFTCQTYGITALQIGTEANPIKAGNPFSPDKWSSYLLDPDGNDIPLTAQDGLVTNGVQPTLTIISAAGGTTVPPPGNYSNAPAANVSVTAIPDSGYTLNYWLLDGGNAGSTNPIAVLMMANHTLQAAFALTTQTNYTLTIVEATGGNTSLLPGTYNNYTAGSSVQISATADEGYAFSYWLLDGSPAGSANPITVLIDGNHTLEPVFSATGFVYVYIRADGSIDPTGVPISTSDNVTYQFEGDLTAIITVQRSNILIVGNGHTLQGSGSLQGFRLILVNNVSVVGLNIRSFDSGFTLSGTSKDVISENNITANNGISISLYSAYNNTIRGNNIFSNKGEGIRLDYASDNNSIFENSMEDNDNQAIYIDSSSDNLVYHNNMVNNNNNTDQVYVAAHGSLPNNSLDNGIEGNYWSDYNGTDSNNDGIRDTPYVIDANNTDRYPLMGLFSRFSLPQGYSVNIISNSTISNFNYSSFEKKMSFNVQGEQGTIGFCRVTIPHALMDVNRLEVLIDNGSAPVLYSNFTLLDDTADRWIFFSYQHSTHIVVIQVDTTPPTIAVLSPENRTYSVDHIPLNFTVSEQTSWEGYSLDGSANVTIPGNTTLTNLPDGLHSIFVYCNDTVGNMGSSNTVTFKVDTTPPNMTQVIQNPPENSVFPSEIVTVNVTVIDSISGVKNATLNYTYTNGSATFVKLVSMTNVQGNIWKGTIPAFVYGTNVTYTILAEDNAGNTITTKEMGFNYQYRVTPEYPALFILPLLMMGSLLTVALAKRKSRNHRMQMQRA